MADKRRTFTKTIDGRQAVAYATTAADAVRLRFSGWREQRPQPTPEPAPAAEPAASKPTTTVTAAAPSRPKAKTDGEDTSRNEVSA